MFDPLKPADHSPDSSAEMREQLTSLKALIDAVPAGPPGPTGEVSQQTLADSIATTAKNPTTVQPLTFEPADPPSMGEIWLLYNKINELIASLQR